MHLQLAYPSALGIVSRLAEWQGLFHLFLLAFVVRVNVDVYQHNVGLSGNVDPCEHPDNFFGEEVVLNIEVRVFFIWFCDDFQECSLDSHSSSCGPQVFVLICGITVRLKRCTGRCGNNGRWFGSCVFAVILCPCTGVFLLLDAIGLSFMNFSYFQQACVACVSEVQNLHHVVA